MELEDFGLLVAAGLIGLLVGLPFWHLVDSWSGIPQPEELSQAICEEEYNADFDYFEKGKIHCTLPPKSDYYDGFRVTIEN